MSAGALDGLRVLDFGQYVSGPLAAMLLADQGADVIRIDPPGGPRWVTPANAVWNRGKRAITLDLTSAQDRAIADRLVTTADILIENFRPGVMRRLGLGPDASMAANPRLVYCSLPGFASDDPRASVQAWEGVVSAAAAAYSPLSRPGDPAVADGDDAPVFSAVPIASCYAAFLTCASIAAALVARQRDGLGQHIEVPMFDATLVAIGYRAQRYLDLAQDPASMAGARILGFYECADGGWIYFHTGSKRAGAFLDAVEAGASSWAAEPGTRPRLEKCFVREPARFWENLGHEVGAEVVAVRTSAQWLAEPAALAAGLTQDVEDPGYGIMRQPGVQARLAGSPGGIRGPAPAPDADRAAIMASLESTADRPDASPSTPASPGAGAAPLAGVKVVDLSIVLAGPTCGRTLSDFGADVIRVDAPPERAARSFGMGRGASGVLSAFNVDVNRGKRSIVLDLTTAEGLDTLWALIAEADVLVENFRDGIAERLGIGYDAVARRHPGIVYASLNMYGYSGPWHGRPGHEQLAQSVSGMAERYGAPGPPTLQNVGALNDYGTGLMGAFAVMLGLRHREQTGQGQHVSTCLAATAGTLQSAFLIDYAGKTWDEPRGLAARGSAPLQRMYPAADAWVFVGARPCDADLLAGALGMTVPAGTAALEAAIAARLCELPAAEAVARLTGAGLGAHRVVPLAEVMADPWVRDHGLVVTREHAGLGRVEHIGVVTRLSRTPAIIGRPAPASGADGAEILRQLGRVS